MRRRVLPVIVVFAGLIAVSCGGSGQLTDPSHNTDQVFTGVIPPANPPGVSTTAFDFFTVASPGLVTVTLNSITPPLALLFTVEIDLAVASSDKTQCAASPITGN